MNKRGVIELSFGMIFSVIIMIAIVGVAVYAITTFLNIGKTTNLALFHQKFQETVDDVWASSITNRVFSFLIPSSVNMVCFGSIAGSSYNPAYENEFRELKRYASRFEQQNTNRFLYPPGKARDFAYKKVDKIDIGGLTNEFDCFAVSDGKVRIRFVKEDFDPLVKIQHE
ncbi:MAG: hypothetical protein UU67_C0084G0007 [Candidatus Daviesbacteria bacterium GW2011_GWB1_41_5]|uniref:Uncharacterized protein n=1 Tax=Candidatus Daviesbacteria bacterium GW2011_GWB1_41_5 TaxID=1618429 RepID=A0A0G0WDX0_9BACT|nr:MAG: hypothetical protein UU67_C0084G0007 [Candidatus Daviesbacteria bacterium GW2011_GWB1_41_5]